VVNGHFLKRGPLGSIQIPYTAALNRAHHVG
jgi:hypothetical protein